MSYGKTTEFLDHDACGFEWSFRKYCQLIDLAENPVSISPTLANQLKNYDDAINIAMDSYSDPNNPLPLTTKIFPVVFHLISESTPNGDTPFINGALGQEITFDVKYILDWVNHWFQGTHIKFELAQLNEDGHELSTSGLNVINGDLINQTRYMGPDKGDEVHNYSLNGVALDTYSRYDTRGGQHKYISGVLFEYIQDNYSWDPLKYINIFLLNRTNSEPGKVVMSSANPYLIELYGNPKRLSIGVDLWAIGRSYNSGIIPGDVNDSVEYTNFGYSYDGTTSESSLQNASSIHEGYRARAKTIAHSLAHTLGLIHPRTRFITRTGYIDGCSSYDYFFDVTSFKRPYDDGDEATHSQSSTDFWKMLTYNEMLEIDSCTDEAIQNISDNIMNHNQFAGGVNTESGIIPTFTENQIKRMHANCEYTTNVFDEDSNQTLFNYGILGQILYNSPTVFLQEQDDDVIDNDGCPESRGISVNDQPLENNAPVPQEEIDSYTQAKNAITGIINNLS